VTASNVYRKYHKASDFKDETTLTDPRLKAALNLNKDLKKLKPNECINGKGKAITTEGLTTCVDVLYKVPETMTTVDEIAKGMTAAWYTDKDNYDYDLGTAKNSKTLDEIAGFTGMIWKGAVKAGTDYAVF
jgi:hypothetical protein